ncbi:hypothetical protein MYX75_06230 [Acidobacteria bacterium AH-259-A15]|nr:hypothetical protein [Acidobacteria bacterium AH-259-A15]
MSSSPKLLRNRCRRLRSKGMFIDVEPDPTVPDMNDGCFWCTHTMNALGPDGKGADDESCRPGRSCYEPV